MTRTRGAALLAYRWQDWLNLLLGAWLFISPSALGFVKVGGAAGSTYSHAAAFNAWIVGVIVVPLSIAALAKGGREEWLNLLAGFWLFISPWVLSYSGTQTALLECAHRRRPGVHPGVLGFKYAARWHRQASLAQLQPSGAFCARRCASSSNQPASHARSTVSCSGARRATTTGTSRTPELCRCKN